MSTRPDPIIDYDYYRRRAAHMRAEAISVGLGKGFSQVMKLRALHYFSISLLVTTVGLLAHISQP